MSNRKHVGCAEARSASVANDALPSLAHPSDLVWRPIGDFVDTVQTWNPSQACPDETFQYIDLSAVDQETKSITGSREVVCSEAPSRARQLVQKHDVLVSTVRPNLNGVAIVPTELNGATASTGFCVLRPVTDLLSGRYLFHWVKSPLFVADMVKKATGASYPAVSDKIVLVSKMPYISLPEQHRIAAILDQADALRAKRREALAQLDSLTQSIFIEMFGDPRTNPLGWPIKAFGTLGENQDAQRIPVKSSDRDEKKGEYPYYGASGIIDWVDEFIYEGERLLIGEDGANLLARSTPIAFLANGKFWVNNHAHVIAASSRANLRFLECFLEQIDLKPYISGSAQPKLNRANLDRIPVPTPPIDLQNAFAERIAAVERLEETAQKSTKELDALFASLQHRAFRGEL